jgi:hypothetical protein
VVCSAFWSSSSVAHAKLSLLHKIAFLVPGRSKNDLAWFLWSDWTWRFISCKRSKWSEEVTSHRHYTLFQWLAIVLWQTEFPYQILLRLVMSSVCKSFIGVINALLRLPLTAAAEEWKACIINLWNKPKNLYWVYLIAEKIWRKIIWTPGSLDARSSTHRQPCKTFRWRSIPYCVRHWLILFW